jgi:malate synthase
MSKNSEQLNENQLQRFTTLINPLVLSHIKLIGYFTNRKLYEVINDSLLLMITDFESKSNTKIDDIINLQNTLSQNMSKEVKS